jgi:hypothetical protein
MWGGREGRLVGRLFLLLRGHAAHPLRDNDHVPFYPMWYARTLVYGLWFIVYCLLFIVYCQSFTAYGLWPTHVPERTRHSLP